MTNSPKSFLGEQPSRAHSESDAELPPTHLPEEAGAGPTAHGPAVTVGPWWDADEGMLWLDGEVINQDLHFPDSLRGVAMHLNAVLAGDFGYLRNWLDDANFIVGEHDGNHRPVRFGQRFGQCRKLEFVQEWMRPSGVVC